MKHTIKSRKLNKEVEFFTGNGTEYVFVNLNGQSGTLGNQICTGGYLSGSTISYTGDSAEDFAKICKNWFDAYLKNNRDYL